MKRRVNPASTPIGIGSAVGETIRVRIKDDQARRLIHLLHLANDLCLAYRTAIRRVTDEKKRDELCALDISHDRLRAQLGNLIQDLGRSPVDSGDLHGLIERGRVIVGRWQGDEGIMRAMADNESELLAALRVERHRPGWPVQVVAVIEEALHLENEHRHHYERALKIFVG
jgi:hypothetical protein